MSERRIYKYDADALGIYVVPCSEPNVVHVAQQHEQTFPTLWVEIDIAKQDAGYSTFHVVGTGQEIPAKSVHIGSAVCGSFVWHVMLAT